MFPRVAAHTLGHINRNIFRFSVGLRMFPVGIFVHVALVPAWGGWGLSSQGGEYRSGSKNGGYFGKRAADARQTSPRNTEVGARMAATSPRNTEVGARMAATSVNREQLQDKQAQGIPK